MLNIKKIGLFLGLTFAACWALAGNFFTTGGVIQSNAGLIFLSLYMILPLIMAIVVQKFIYHEKIFKPFGIFTRPHWGWLLLALFTPVLLASIAFALTLLMIPTAKYDGNMSALIALTAKSTQMNPQIKTNIANTPLDIKMILLALYMTYIGISSKYLISLAEEVGWRGFLLRELRPLGFWPASFTIGLIWGVWSAPMAWVGLDYPEHKVISVILAIAFFTLFAPIITYFRLRAKTIFASALMLSLIEGMALFSIAWVKGGNFLTNGLFGLPGLLTLAIVNVFLFYYEGSRAKTPVLEELTLEVRQEIVAE